MSTKTGVVAVMAEFETPHFGFMAFGADEDEARKLLEQAWKVHAANTGGDPGYLKEHEDGINYTEIKLGVVLRDGFEIQLGEATSASSDGRCGETERKRWANGMAERRCNKKPHQDGEHRFGKWVTA